MRWCIGVAITVVGLGFLGWSIHGGHPPICPHHTQSDANRTEQLMALLRGIPEASKIVDRSARDPVVCFGAISAGMLQTDGVLVLPTTEGSHSNAARLGHLLFHHVEGPLFDAEAIRSSALPCSELVERAMVREREAHALEERLRRAMGLEPLSEGLADLQSAYAERCRRLRLVR